MSGGAVLDGNSALIGLYRGQSPTHLSKVAVQIQAIQSVLQENGWEFLVSPPRLAPRFQKSVVAAASALLLLVALGIAMLLFWLRVPKAELVTDAQQVSPDVLFQPVADLVPADADRLSIEDVHYYHAASQHTQQPLKEVPGDRELVVADYEHQGPDAELIALTRGTYWSLGKLRATSGSPTKLNVVVPPKSTLAIRTTQSGVIRFKANVYLRESTAFLRTVVNVRASLFSPTLSGGISWADVPLGGCEISAQPVGFQPQKILPVPSDNEGKATLVIEHAPDLKQLQVYFQVTKVSESFASLQPLLPLKLGVVSVGQVMHYPYNDPAELVVGKEQERDLQVIPYSEFDKFNRPLVAKSLSAPAWSDGGSGSTASVAGSGSDKIQVLATKTGIQSQYVQTALESWAERLSRERPVIELASLPNTTFDESQWPDAERMREIVASASPGVCLVRPKPQAANVGQFGVGFLIAKDTVLCASPLNLSEGAEVSFDDRPLESGATFKPVKNVLYENGNYKILDVPDCPDHVLAWESTVSGGESPRVLVIGYPVKDARLPNEIQTMMADVDHPVKALMPGKVTPTPETTNNADFNYIGHDATTSGGTMGAPIIDQVTGKVVGLHCGGRWESSTKSNFGIPMEEFMAKGEIRELLVSRGLKFPEKFYAVQRGIDPPGYSSNFLNDLSLPLPQVPETFFKTKPLVYENFEVLMNLNRGIMVYAAVNIDRANLHDSEGTNEFHFDWRLPAYEQLGSEFYANNEFVGKQVVSPAWVAWGEPDSVTSALDAVQGYPNVVPQLNWFHDQAWSRLQSYVLSEMNPSAKRVTVFAGPVIAADDPDYRGRKIPQAYWLVAATQDPAKPTRVSSEAWIVPQLQMKDGLPVQTPITGDVVQSFRVSLEEVESRTQLRFAEALHKQ